MRLCELIISITDFLDAGEMRRVVKKPTDEGGLCGNGLFRTEVFLDRLRDGFAVGFVL